MKQLKRLFASYQSESKIKIFIYSPETVLYYRAHTIVGVKSNIYESNSYGFSNGCSIVVTRKKITYI
jgi:hypothetical protein